MTIFQKRNPIIIIPVYCPDKRLINLIKEIRNKVDFPIIVIDDGSGDKYSNIFLESKKFSNCLLYHNNINKGKGATLKNGVAYAIDKFPNNCGYITCDADGQHSAEDIINIADILIKNPSSLILGIRDFSLNTIPYKIRIRNRISSLLLYFISGSKCSNTQTGLRGIPRSKETLFLSEPGDKYDFEMNFLASIAKSSVEIKEVPIKTTCIDINCYHSIIFYTLLYLKKYSLF
ncbi:glycosyltransferase family 2 protein [Clostridium sp. D53t1_180928_C8]|uniref:glycosyltransferase family 2 protein n=1 Tax=Clostridium sp. D53t1_180928_C8 TaxID=2787101 RepID=UPI0018ABA9BC|nr:glycosyltransferase family 2 protein [Clostridium sp. D53t1_180928_C8]